MKDGQASGTRIVLRMYTVSQIGARVGPVTASSQIGAPSRKSVLELQAVLDARNKFHRLGIPVGLGPSYRYPGVAFEDSLDREKEVEFGEALHDAQHAPLEPSGERSEMGRRKRDNHFTVTAVQAPRARTYKVAPEAPSVRR
jgi:hypothetical protein